MGSARAPRRSEDRRSLPAHRPGLRLAVPNLLTGVLVASSYQHAGRLTALNAMRGADGPEGVLDQYATYQGVSDTLRAGCDRYAASYALARSLAEHAVHVRGKAERLAEEARAAKERAEQAAAAASPARERDAATQTSSNTPQPASPRRHRLRHCRPHPLAAVTEPPRPSPTPRASSASSRLGPAPVSVDSMYYWTPPNFFARV